MRETRSGPPPLLVSYTDLSDVWSETGLAGTDGDGLSTLNLQQVPVKTQNSAVRLLKDVQTRLVTSSACERLCVDWSGSPASWFRQPVAELVTFRCAGWEAYKKNFRLQLRAMAHGRSPTDPVPIFVYVTRGPLDKTGRAVLDAVQKELSPRAVVHLGQNGTVGMQDLLGAVKSALVQSLDGRVGAYRAEVQRLVDTDPEGEDVDVGALYVLKDSLGAMFESTGMYQEACNEYSELEAMIEDCVGRCAAVVGNEGEGGKAGHGESAGAEGHSSPDGFERSPSYQTECSVSQVAGVDECRQLWHAWDGTRRAVAAMARDGDAGTMLTRSFVDFVLVPSIVCNMVRILMKDSKRVEALRVCRAFIGNHRAVLARYEQQRKCPAGMEMAWTFSACVSSVLRICMDVQDAEKLEDIGLLDRLAAAVRDEEGGSDIARMNAKFHLAVGQLLLEARDILLSLPDGDVGEQAITNESVLDLMRRVDTGSFSTKSSSLTPQNSLSTPRASAMASMASMMSTSTRPEAGRSMENIDLDQMRSLGDVSGDLDALGGDEHDLRRPSHERSISLHQPTMESVFSSGSISSNATAAEAATLTTKPAAMSLLDVEAAIDGHAAPLFLILGREDDEITIPWIPTYRPVRSIWSVDPDSGLLVRPDERKRVRSTIVSAANAFFERCGYVRTAGVLSVRLADDAYEEKQFATATGILLELADRLEEENWRGAMYEDVMLRLVRSQVRDGDNGIIGTCHRLLRSRCNSTHASMLLRATELAASNNRRNGGARDADCHIAREWMNGDATPVISLDPCLHVLRGGRGGSPSMHFVGDSIRVPIRLFNDAGVLITLRDLHALFKIEQDEVDAVNGPDPGGASLTSPRLRHLMVDHPSPASPSSPFFSNQSPTEDLNSALRWEAAGKLAAEPAMLVGTLASGQTLVSIDVAGPSLEDSQELEFLITPIVSGTYSLTKLRASINGTLVEMTPDASLVQLHVEPPEPRIRVETVTRTLVAGEEQWLGVEIDVLRDDSGPPTAMNVEWPSSICPGSPSAVVNGERFEPDESLNVPNTLQYTISRPRYTVWWRARVDKSLDTPPEEVRVSCGWSPNPGMGGAGVRTAFQPSHLNSKANQQHQNIIPMRFHHLPVSVLFESEEQHCSRVASASALVAIDLPFLLRTDAKEVRKGVILMTIQISSTSPDRTVAIHGVELRPQQGFSVSRFGSGQDTGGHPDMRGREVPQDEIIGPTSSMCASFLLSLDQSLLENRAVAQATVYRTGKLAPSVASIAYSVVVDSDPITSTAPCRDPSLPLSASKAPSPSETYMHEHSIALQLSSISTDSLANNEYISLRMLGPFSATIGCPVTLCWQLERVGGPEESTRNGRLIGISYEVRADAACWSKSSRSQGSVALGKRNGSIATVEMAWTPTTIGPVPVPTLRLHDVYYVQEGRGRNMINVNM